MATNNSAAGGSGTGRNVGSELAFLTRALKAPSLAAAVEWECQAAVAPG